jgi:hypothetical protein
MPDSTLAQIVTAVTGIGTMVALVLGGIAALITARKLGRKVDEVHTIVNHQRDVMVQEIKDRKEYQGSLIRALEAKGIDVPRDQSAGSTDNADR